MVGLTHRAGASPGAQPCLAAFHPSSWDDAKPLSRLTSGSRRPARWLRVDLVDVRQATVQRVRIWTEGPMLQIAGQSLLRQVPLTQIDWRQEMGPSRHRMARLPDGSTLCAVQPQEWDDWCQLAVTSTQTRHVPAARRLLWIGVVAILGLLWLGTWFLHLPTTPG